MKVKDIIHRSPLSVHRHQTLSQAAEIMWDYDLGAVPIVDEDNRVVGMITDRDIAMAALMQSRPLSEIVVESAMSKNLYCCELNEEVYNALALMQQHQIRRMPVLDGNKKLVGVLSLNDMARAYAKSGKKEIKAEAIADTLAAISRHRHGHVVGQQVA